MASTQPMPVVEEGKMLGEALNTVKIQVQQMKRYLELDQLMDALKSASLMLAELRTSSLSPKQYYELYMAVFDALRHLSNYLSDAHTAGKHHLADLYELVQYAGNIVPRLYLMMTVGSVYMGIPDAPVKEIMKDMMEMSRGVLHPIRGLFLRHYLSGQTRDHMPIGTSDGPEGNLEDSLDFVITNFVEMNKLWVRLQHQGHSRDREKREMERRELRILVGTNLVRLSQLDGVEFPMYQKLILPSILEQVVNCKDVIAQEYLMEVIIQVFPDEFHLHSLGPFLSATAQLHPKVNIKNIVISLIDRLAAFAAREAENEDPEESKKQEEAAAKRLADKVKVQKAARAKEQSVREWQQQQEERPASPEVPAEANAWGDAPSSTSVFSHTEVDTEPEPETPKEAEQEKPQPAPPNGDAAQTAEKAKEGEKAPAGPRKFRGVPEDVQLFEVFWKQVVELIKARPDLSIQDVTALIVSLTNLSLSCYPDRLEYVDQVLAYCAEKISGYTSSADLHHPQTTANLASLLIAPINSYQSVLTLLAIPNYSPLLQKQLFSTRRSIAHAIVSSVLKNETVVETREDVDGVLELCEVLIKDQGAAPSAPGSASVNGQEQQQQRQPQRGGPAGAQFVEKEEMAEEQGWVARMVHLFRSDSLDVQFELLQTARRHFEAGGERIRFTFPALITSAIKLCRRYKNRADIEKDWKDQVETILKFVRQLTSILANNVDSPGIALRLFLLAAQISDECGFEDLTYDLYVQAFTVYEDSISESRAQLQAITLVIGTLSQAKVFGEDNYDTLITKAALHGAKLLKKSHQSSAVVLASHLWWQQEAKEQSSAVDEAGSEDGEEKKETKKKEGGEDEKDEKKDGKEGKEKTLRKAKSALGLDGEEAVKKAFPHRDSKRVLECLQKSLRIAGSAIEEIVKVQLYVDTLNQYVYYLDQGAPAVIPMFVNKLVEIICEKIDDIYVDIHPSHRTPPGLIENVHTPDMISRHFRNTLYYIQRKKVVASEGAPGVDPRWDDVDVVGALLKMGLMSR